jgi:hypothetical protein
VEPTSPFAEVNPYAAPLGEAQPDWSLAAGVGCWRHGSLLVVHEDAQLPPICVKTGKPAAAYHGAQIRWSHPLRWPRECFSLNVPLSQRPLYFFRSGRPLVLAAAIASSTLTAAVLVLMVIAASRVPDDIRTTAIAVGAIVSITLFVCYAALAQPLWLVRRRRNYYWLSGASRRFRDQLPPWPF